MSVARKVGYWLIGIGGGCVALAFLCALLIGLAVTIMDMAPPSYILKGVPVLLGTGGLLAMLGTLLGGSR